MPQSEVTKRFMTTSLLRTLECPANAVPSERENPAVAGDLHALAGHEAVAIDVDRLRAAIVHVDVEPVAARAQDRDRADGSGSGRRWRDGVAFRGDVVRIHQATS